MSIYKKLGTIYTAALDECTFCDDSKRRLITRINVPEKYRRQGIGTQLLKQMIEVADNEKLTLYIQPFASGDMGILDLIKWYKKHGFIIAKSGVMKRSPGGATAIDDDEFVYKIKSRDLFA